MHCLSKVLGLCFMPKVMVEEKDVCLVEYVGTIGGVEDNYGKPPNFVVHGNISNVENVHM